MSGIGTIIDNKYELLQYINKGGMSAVYLAVNTRLGNRWAVKEIKKTNEKYNQIYINSLIAEAHLMKDLDHPAFPRIVDIIETEDCLYLVMDYIEGQTMEQVLKECGPQDEKVVAGWAIEICKALSYLHNHKPPIIYRDMKPSNIIIKPNGSLKIIDFGTARVFDSGKANDTVALGTKGFAPPEQYSGQTDARSDIYALGMTIKYLITGINPCLEYSSHTYYSKPVSESMQAVIDKCIAVNLENRYQSCEELSNDLVRLFRKSKSTKSHLLKKIMIAVIAVLVVSGITAGLTAVVRTINKNNEHEKAMMTTVPATMQSSTTTCTVPDVVGMDIDEAVSLLEDAGFSVEPKEEYDDDIESGHIIRQSIESGTRLDKPQAIILFVSKGKESKSSNSSDDTSKRTNSDNSSEKSSDNNDGYLSNNTQENKSDNEKREGGKSENSNVASNNNESSNSTNHSDYKSSDENSSGGDTEGGGYESIWEPEFEEPNDHELEVIID